MPMVRSQTERIKGIVEQGLGHLFITSSSSRFFTETDLFSVLEVIRETIGTCMYCEIEAIMISLFRT